MGWCLGRTWLAGCCPCRCFVLGSSGATVPTGCSVRRDSFGCSRHLGLRTPYSLLCPARAHRPHCMMHIETSQLVAFSALTFHFRETAHPFLPLTPALEHLYPPALPKILRRPLRIRNQWQFLAPDAPAKATRFPRSRNFVASFSDQGKRLVSIFKRASVAN